MLSCSWLKLLPIAFALQELLTYPMDPEDGHYYTDDGKRLTRVRVAGLALELAFQWVHSVGLFALKLAHFANLGVGVTADTWASKRKVSFGVQAAHQQAIMDGIQDVLPRLHNAGYVMVGVLVPQRGHLAKHDVVLEYRKIGEPCLGQYSCELKLRTRPANRCAMRSDCAGLFAVACRESTKWLGQIIICIEITSVGTFLQSRAELLVRGRSRDAASNLWGWTGAPGTAPTQPNPQLTAPTSRPVPKAIVSPSRLMRPEPAAPPPKPSFASVWANLKKYDASWTADSVVLFKQFFIQLGPRFKTNVTNCSRVVASNRGPPLNWRAGVHYDYAKTKAEGRVNQGGGAPPVIVSKTAVKAYYEIL